MNRAPSGGVRDAVRDVVTIVTVMPCPTIRRCQTLEESRAAEVTHAICSAPYSDTDPVFTREAAYYRVK